MCVWFLTQLDTGLHSVQFYQNIFHRNQIYTQLSEELNCHNSCLLLATMMPASDCYNNV